MNLRQWAFFIFLSILINLCFCEESYATVNNDFGDWTFTTINVPLSDKFLFQEVINTTVNDNLSNFGLLFLRSSVGYQTNPNVSLWIGHDWFAKFSGGFAQENRVWEQVLINHEIGRYKLSHRIRQEERMFPDAGGAATLRYLGRVDRPLHVIKNDNFSAIVWDEVFVNEIGNNENVKAGYAENRMFLGLGYRFNKNLTLEGGYMLQHVSRTSDDSLNHWLFTNLVINL